LFVAVLVPALCNCAQLSPEEKESVQHRLEDLEARFDLNQRLADVEARQASFSQAVEERLAVLEKQVRDLDLRRTEERISNLEQQLNGTLVTRPIKSWRSFAALWFVAGPGLIVASMRLYTADFSESCLLFPTIISVGVFLLGSTIQFVFL
jgi:hypothetical protein